eukprot:7388328-Pyramimonas_sp.AAC.1
MRVRIEWPQAKAFGDSREHLAAQLAVEVPQRAVWAAGGLQAEEGLPQPAVLYGDGVVEGPCLPGGAERRLVQDRDHHGVPRAGGRHRCDDALADQGHSLEGAEVTRVGDCHRDGHPRGSEHDHPARDRQGCQTRQWQPRLGRGASVPADSAPGRSRQGSPGLLV